jgi:hypothetical protein
MGDDRLRFNSALLSLEDSDAICFPLPPVEFRRHSNPHKNLTPAGSQARFDRVVRVARILRLRERGQHTPDKCQSA